VEYAHLVEIEGTVVKPIEIKESGKRKKRKSRYINIALEEYPKFEFSLGGHRYKATNAKELIVNVQQGERIKMKILNDQFQKKLTKEVPMTFWDKSFDYRSISIYGLSDDQTSYFNLNKFNKYQKADRNYWAMYILLGFGLFVMGYGIYELMLNKKPVNVKTKKYR
ncbi:MAG: hypothetical protein AB8G22_28160, partial [Saprospiraceae bacterium]